MHFCRVVEDTDELRRTVRECGGTACVDGKLPPAPRPLRAQPYILYSPATTTSTTTATTTIEAAIEAGFGHFRKEVPPAPLVVTAGWAYAVEHRTEVHHRPSDEGSGRPQPPGYHRRVRLHVTLTKSAASSSWSQPSPRASSHTRCTNTQQKTSGKTGSRDEKSHTSPHNPSTAVHFGRRPGRRAVNTFTDRVAAFGCARELHEVATFFP